MTTRKKTSSAPTTPSVGLGKNSRKRGTFAKRGVTAHAGDGSGWNLAMRAMPGAAALVTGFAGVAGYVFRKSLLDALKAGTDETANAARALSALAAGARGQAGDSFERLLSGVGLERRRPLLLSMAGPALGAVCGFAAGAALTYLFGPQLLAQFGLGGPPGNDVQPIPPERVASASNAAPMADGSFTNGGSTASHHPAS